VPADRGRDRPRRGAAGGRVSAIELTAADMVAGHPTIRVSAPSVSRRSTKRW
jgi:hypothetical protein